MQIFIRKFAKTAFSNGIIYRESSVLASIGKAQAKTIAKWGYNLYGCKIGMLGNNCVITAREQDLPWKDVQEFAFYCEQKAENHPDIVVPVVTKSIVLRSLKTDKDGKTVRRAQYSMLVYEFIENWLDKFIDNKSESVS